MYWRLPRHEYESIRGEGARLALKKLVESGAAPGILAYADGAPIGWCALAPREAYPVLERSRILKRVDSQPVWSIVCFFVARRWRRKGLTVRLLQAAVEFARERGATIIEGYPVEPKEQWPDAFVYTGLASAFRKAGFVQVARRSETRPIMRWEAGSAKGEA
jgi:GNAT superfamily N-acetyltransferase